MKTCTQISDSGFRGNLINLVSPGDSAKQGSPGVCKREVKSSPLSTRVSPTKRAGPPP